MAALSQQEQKPSRRGLFLLGGLALAACILTAIFMFPARKRSAADSPPAPRRELGVGCLGRIEPEDGVLEVAAPYFAARPSVVTQVLVKQNEWVSAGQSLAVLDGRAPSQAVLRLSEARLRVARSHLERVKAGEKSSDIAAQEAEVSRRKAELANAETEYGRAERLFAKQDYTVVERDDRKLAFERASKSLDAARQKLASLAEVRQTDLALANAEVEAAQAEVNRARAELDLTLVKAPVAGRILRILVHAGEQAGGRAVLEMGKTERMFVSAEVYETDIARVRLGQRAVISSDLFPGQLTGRVSEVGTQITKSEVLPLDPAVFSDARIVKVKIRMDDSQAVAGLLNGKVAVRIEP
jgi:HlyD family secretion protein